MSPSPDAEPSSAALGSAIARLAAAQVFALSVWFSTSAVLPALARARGLEPSALAGLATATQLGFVLGALALGLSGLADRVPPSRFFAGCAAAAAALNLVPGFLAPEGLLAWLARFGVGAALAGVYPVGIRLAVGWTRTRRGWVSALLVGGLTLGTSSPHFVAAMGGVHVSFTLFSTSALAVVAALLVLSVQPGPFHASAPRADPRALGLAWTDPAIRGAYLGYFGHMWELYGYWAWGGVMAAAAARAGGWSVSAAFGPWMAFSAIAAGAVACVLGGRWADRIGKARVARMALIGSLASAVLAAVSFDAAPGLFMVALILWGITVIPDSPQFSALVADAAPPERAGSLLTFQIAIGFTISAITVQVTPTLAEAFGWPVACLVLGAGPLAGLLGLRSGDR